MNIAVCEDDRADNLLICDFLREYCRRNYLLARVQSFMSAEALLRDFAAGSYDLIFLDIYMPGINGIEAARHIRTLDRHCELLFITSSPDFALEGFAVHALSYLLKPIAPREIENALQHYQRLFTASNRYLEITVDYQSVRVPLRSILYIEIFNKAALVHTDDGVLKSYAALDDIESMLSDSSFLRCHRSYLVNMNRVADVLEHSVRMQSGESIPIRKNGRATVKLILARFLAGLVD